MTESPTEKSATSTFLRRRVGPPLVAVAAARTAGASIFDLVVAQRHRLIRWPTKPVPKACA